MDQLKCLLVESDSIMTELSVETLARKVLPVVTENFQFEYRRKSKKLNFPNFLTIKIMMEGLQKLIFGSNHSPQLSGCRLRP